VVEDGVWPLLTRRAARSLAHLFPLLPASAPLFFTTITGERDVVERIFLSELAELVRHTEMIGRGLRGRVARVDGFFCTRLFFSPGSPFRNCPVFFPLEVS